MDWIRILHLRTYSILYRMSVMFLSSSYSIQVLRIRDVDPGSWIPDTKTATKEIRDPEKTYSGSRIQGQKGTGSRIQHWIGHRPFLPDAVFFLLSYLALPFS